MILSCNNITKSFGTDAILKHVSFHIEEREKAAIVGINGAGKSTLLKIIVGELAADEGTVTVSRGKTLGYLAQHQDIQSGATIYDELLTVKAPVLELERQIRSLELQMKQASGQELETLLNTYSRLNHEFELANGYAWQSEITGVLKGLGFGEDEFSKPVSQLSGGQKTRVSLGKLLLSKPDIILLDEPTNHLDMESIAWLEGYLMNYAGTVIIVAHDRYFLDRIVTRIVELDNGVATTFLGNYSAYSEKKARLRADILKAYLNQQQEIRHQEEVIAKLRSFNREKSIKRAESREKLLSRMEVLEKPVELNDAMHITLEPCVVSGTDVLEVRGLAKAFNGVSLFSGVDFDIRRGERIAIIGNNGTGKTTILKMLNGLLPPDEGEIRFGSRVHVGYYDQEHQVLHMEKTLFDELQDTYPDMNNTQIRNVLAAFLFTGDDVFKRIGDLSGGERGRVSLAKLMLSEANFLILDEPTNHLDITSKEILENALVHYTGTVLYVSHDRYFINKTATRILDLKMGTLINYIGNYDYYLEKHEMMERICAEKLAQSGRRTTGGTRPNGGVPGAFAGGAVPGAAFTASVSGAASGAALASSAGGTASGAFSKASSGAPSDSSGNGAVSNAFTDSSLSRLSPDAPASGASAGQLDWKQQKEEQARLRKRQNELKRVEEEIHRLETRDQEINALLCDEAVFSDAAKLMEFNREKEDIASKLETLYEKWEELAE